MTTFPAYRRIASPDGPMFDSFHKIEKFEHPPCYMVTQTAMVKPIEIGSRIHKLIEGSERTTRKQFEQKMKDVYNYIK